MTTAVHITHYPLTIPVDGVEIEGDLFVPEKATGLVIFSHGSGSSRFSPRNRMVAGHLHDERFATLLIDLLTPEEDRTYRTRFDIPLLTGRLKEVTNHVKGIQAVASLPIGYFGASTGGASAIAAAAQLPGAVRAIVSRGGRPDLAKEYLRLLNTPVLLLVGSLDEEVIALNAGAYKLIPCEKKMQIIEGASHLFEEEGKLEEVADAALAWFSKYLH